SVAPLPSLFPSRSPPRPAPAAPSTLLPAPQFSSASHRPRWQAASNPRLLVCSPPPTPPGATNPTATHASFPPMPAQSPPPPPSHPSLSPILPAPPPIPVPRARSPPSPQTH